MDPSSLIYPMFVKEGDVAAEEIPTMPGQYRYSLDGMERQLDALLAAGVNSVMLFGIPDHKDEMGSGAWDENGIIQKALRRIKKEYRDELYVIMMYACASIRLTVTAVCSAAMRSTMTVHWICSRRRHCPTFRQGPIWSLRLT